MVDSRTERCDLWIASRRVNLQIARDLADIVYRKYSMSSEQIANLLSRVDAAKRWRRWILLQLDALDGDVKNNVNELAIFVPCGLHSLSGKTGKKLA